MKIPSAGEREKYHARKSGRMIYANGLIPYMGNVPGWLDMGSGNRTEAMANTLVRSVSDGIWR